MKVHRNWAYTIEEVCEEFELRGYTLLESEYKNSATKMRYRCEKHPDKELFIRFRDLKHGGKGCVYCAGLNKPNFEEVRQRFDELGLILLEKEYKNQRTKMRYRCQKHPELIQSAIYKTIKKGHGCKKCGYEKASKKNSGDGNWNWNGGVSELRDFLRKTVDEWKFDSLKAHDFKCVITDEKAQDLQVHHLTPFHVIRDEALNELGLSVYENIGDYTEFELNRIVDLVHLKHKEELGVPLRYHIHRLFHSEYGNSATSEDFEEFKQRYHSGEFDEKEAIV